MIHPEIGLNVPHTAYRVKEARQEPVSERLSRQGPGILARLMSHLGHAFRTVTKRRQQQGPRPPSLIL